MAKSQEMVFDDFDTPGQSGLEMEPGEAAAKVSDGAAAPAKTTESAATPGKPDKAEAKEADALRRRIAELELESRFWADKAKTAAPAPAKEEPKDDELEALLAGGVDDDTAASLLDEIGEKGVVALEKRGIVTKGQMKAILAAQERKLLAKATEIAESRVTGATEKLTAEAKLLKEYPELADETSEFSKAVGAEFASMVADDPSLKNSYSALRMAARVVKAQKGAGASASGLPGRLQRIAAQSPRRGAAASDFEDDGEIEISPEARQLIAAGARYGLTEDAYKRSARRTA